MQLASDLDLPPLPRDPPAFALSRKPLDALHGAQGYKIVDWKTMEQRPVPPLFKTGASFHYVDNGIDSGEVIADVLGTDIDPQDTILELRWNNFQHSLFPALRKGLEMMARAPADTPADTTV